MQWDIPRTEESINLVVGFAVVAAMHMIILEAEDLIPAVGIRYIETESFVGSAQEGCNFEVAVAVAVAVAGQLAELAETSIVRLDWVAVHSDLAKVSQVTNSK